jgi:hypothetical protein
VKIKNAVIEEAFELSQLRSVSVHYVMDRNKGAKINTGLQLRLSIIYAFFYYSDTCGILRNKASKTPMSLPVTHRL